PGAATTGDKMIINPGSVGLPAYEDPSPPAHVSESGSPAARYAVLQLNGDQASLEHIAIPYDHAAAARRAEENQSRGWAHFLSTGFARNLANFISRETRERNVILGRYQLMCGTAGEGRRLAWGRGSARKKFGVAAGHNPHIGEATLWGRSGAQT